jgi:hypothetical protein
MYGVHQVGAGFGSAYACGGQHQGSSENNAVEAIGFHTRAFQLAAVVMIPPELR